ncbi:unnamed protein product [Euphydryas editha]|uniref:Uncharacterized protein n=1 Tax=Euphydryas editha TaxID=104508 RepID=A0AAU9TV60_EUPED|nr:unnamed protein product [Euphydryas editha]
MDKECLHCNALNFKNESAGMFCASGKVLEMVNNLIRHSKQKKSDNDAIFINPDKTPAGEYICCFNIPVVDEVAEIMVYDRTATQVIMIRRRNNNLEFIVDTHRSYDALQYPD